METTMNNIFVYNNYKNSDLIRDWKKEVLIRWETECINLKKFRVNRWVVIYCKGWIQWKQFTSTTKWIFHLFTLNSEDLTKVPKLKLMKIFLKGKMLPLEEDQRIFTWFGICSVEKSVFHNAKTLCTVLNVINYAYQVLIFGASVLYFFKFISIDLVEALNSLHQTVGLFGVLYSLTVALLYRTEIRSIFSKYQQFYDECKFILKSQYNILVDYK